MVDVREVKIQELTTSVFFRRVTTIIITLIILKERVCYCCCFFGWGLGGVCIMMIIKQMFIQQAFHTKGVIYVSAAAAFRGSSFHSLTVLGRNRSRLYNHCGWHCGSRGFKAVQTCLRCLDRGLASSPWPQHSVELPFLPPAPLTSFPFPTTLRSKRLKRKES